MSPCYFGGFGRASVTHFAEGLCLFGWGHRDNVARGIAAPLFARALVLEEASTGRRVAYVCCDLGMISESVRTTVVERAAVFGLDDASVMLTATHTHSGPSGFSTYLFYANAGPGFSRSVHDGIVDGIVRAIADAVDALEPVRLYVGRDALPVSEPIAWNRSLDAYNRNRDVSPLPADRSDEAVDRTMTVLRVDAAGGTRLGLVSFFGTHGTCIHRENTLLHPDHKGEAARYLEELESEAGNPGYVAIFAQTTPGDVTPNHRWDPRRGLVVGRYESDFDSARFVGEVQARYARAIAERAAARREEVRGPLACGIRFTDFFDAPVDPKFVHGRSGLRTTEPVVGWSFSTGTREGPGPLGTLRATISWMASLQSARVQRGTTDDVARFQGAKFPLSELGRGHRSLILGIVPASSAALRLVPDRFLRYFHDGATGSAARDLPWVPRHLPVHVVRIGQLVLGGVPMEPTTQSGRRIARALGRAIGVEGSYVVVNGYANAYAGYLTTPEEYAVQTYEGGSTLFGEWSLPAICTAFDTLATELRECSEVVAGARAPSIPLESWVPPALHPLSPIHEGVA